ncbi:hypothetical protein CYMTET_16540 [Cymbomonas tetramitiformis]|uniref:Uncharacterized protein n=1 Tax=Cymbomonas tetramitiformis TaxID=36881 RepID=A0AAE0GCC5_9CHLO|nr:hypothetical protein CYMTET_16540 [Cymbomonas tetramitiformis]
MKGGLGRSPPQSDPSSDNYNVFGPGYQLKRCLDQHKKACGRTDPEENPGVRGGTTLASKLPTKQRTDPDVPSW